MTAADDAYDLVVIGGGIVGIAHAVAALERGMRVAMIERDGVCRAASVRNFGMLWPIGQRPGADEARALRSLDAWSKLAPLAGFTLPAALGPDARHKSSRVGCLLIKPGCRALQICSS